MKCDTTRRAFMRRSAAAGSCLLWGGLPATRRLCGATPRPSHATQSTTGGEGRGGSAQGPFTPVTVITQPVSRDANPRAGLWGYITEILQHAGLLFETLPPSELSSLAKRPQAIILLAGDLPLAPAEREILANLVNKGASLIGIGGTSGMDQVFGVASSRPLAEGWIKVTATEHPVTAGLRSSLHVFGGCLAKPASATSLATAEGAARARAAALCWKIALGKEPRLARARISSSPLPISSRVCPYCRMPIRRPTIPRP